MAITIDKEKCIGCGACVAAVPDVFEMDDAGKSKVKDGADETKAKEGVDVCPVQAIKVE